jgi:hypothetical protein
MKATSVWVLPAVLWSGSILGQSTGLVDAAGKGDTATMRVLLANGADPNATDDSYINGWTPLMAAAKAGSADAVEVLLGANANVNATNGYGGTALDVAAGNHGFSSGVAALIYSAGGNGRERDKVAAAWRMQQRAKTVGAPSPLATEFDPRAPTAVFGDRSAPADYLRTARSEQNAAKRRAAVRKVTDQSALARIADEDADFFVRREAVATLVKTIVNKAIMVRAGCEGYGVKARRSQSLGRSAQFLAWYLPDNVVVDGSGGLEALDLYAQEAGRPKLDLPLTVFLLDTSDSPSGARYSISGQPAMIERLSVCVIQFDRITDPGRAVGFNSFVASPPARRAVQARPEYGNPLPLFAEWFKTLPVN